MNVRIHLPDFFFGLTRYGTKQHWCCQMCSHSLLHSMWHKAGEPATSCHAHSHRLSHTMWYVAGKKNANHIHTGFYTQCNGGLKINPSAFASAFTHNATQGWWTNEQIHINLYTVTKTGVPVFPCIPDEGYGISLHDGWRIKKKHCIHTVICIPRIAD